MASRSNKGNVQCKACPWRKDVKPIKDIPGGYCENKHKALDSTIANPGDLRGLAGPLRVMACHESPIGAERACVGWVHNQLGVGNNIALRLQARDGRYNDFRTVGKQWQTLKETLKNNSED
jgi:hypothetical protein